MNTLVTKARSPPNCKLFAIAVRPTALEITARRPDPIDNVGDDLVAFTEAPTKQHGLA